MALNLSSLNESLILNTRTIIEIQGEGGKDFLQGLVTNDLSKLSLDHAIYALFLTSKGRYDLDCFIYELSHDQIFLDIPSDSAPTLLKKLNMYKLRRPLTITLKEDLRVWVGSASSVDALYGPWTDPRCANLNLRWISYNLVNGDLGDEAYQFYLMGHGIPSHGFELIPDKTIPLEANLDLLNAISFEKGCYVGQELTSRTHFQGEIRKRFLPFQMEEGESLKDDCLEQEVTFKGEGVGQITSTSATGGMGRFWVDAFKQSIQTSTPFELGAIKLYPFIPSYLESTLKL